ncbi:uncharacterized protein LOC107646783 [Arachis ipaensis]|uniref:uncharacterized protein LOC107646783 n=1 Tax=Arachis ipaensis TaxID=130454 RepID=UPI0007AFDB5F|nr:uncharacterized protein LOC107646783 [Arachis ipaensis]
MGAKIDQTITNSKGPRTFILYGENYHLMGSLILEEVCMARFAQLYVYDTQNEIQNCIAVIRGKDNNKINEDIVKDLKKMLDNNNVLVKAFRMVRESIGSDYTSMVKLRLFGKWGKDGRRNNLPSTNEVAALIVGDFDFAKTDRDIVVETHSGRLQRINQLNPTYLALQYPLLFPYGKDGYKEDIPLNKKCGKEDKGRQEVSMKEFFAFRIQERLADVSPLLYSRRFFQRFLVDGFSMIESARLNYVRLDQEKFKCEMYKGLSEAMLSGKTRLASRGKRIILPSSFTGGSRYMIQNYQDAMAIYRVVGYPDLFFLHSHVIQNDLNYKIFLRIENYMQKTDQTWYISSCEAAWRIFGYSIHYRNPSVVRLGFHLPGKQPVIFKDDENLDDIARKEFVKEFIFLEWFEIMGRKANSDATFLDIEISHYKKEKYIEVEEVPFEGSKERKASNELDGLGLELNDKIDDA